MSKNSFGQIYRRLSSKVLDLVVKPRVLGDIPKPNSAEQIPDHAKNIPSQTAICYVLQSYSRSNALVLDAETRRLNLPPALEPLLLDTLQEKTSVFFLQHQDTSYLAQKKHALPPKLIRLIDFLENHPDADVTLRPVTILWGRAPDKENSLFKLLFTDTWATPSKVKQLVNIGLHGRQSFLEFHPECSLRALMTTAQEVHPNLSAATYIVNDFNQYLDRQREAVLGPDLSDRRNVIQSLMKSPDLQDSIRRESIRSKTSLFESERKAVGYINEIVSDYSYSTIRFADMALTRLWTQLYDGVEVHNFNTVRELAKDYQVIYTPCHRSHIDYLLLSYIIHRRGLMVPYIAAGDNLNLPFVGQFLRGGGAFFIRRSFRGNGLYTSVFKEYLYSIVSRNTPLEYFIEGGRSRTGRLLPPKTGMLAMTVHSHLRNKGKNKPIVFIPTYIGYERLMEGSTYIGELQGKPKEAESVLGLLKTVRKIERIFGQVHLNFGEPVFLDDVLKSHDADQIHIAKNDDPIPPEVSQAITSSAYEILEKINNAVVINPVTLLSLILLSTEKQTVSEDLLVKQLNAYRNMATQQAYDERTEVTTLSGQDIIQHGLKLKLIKRVPHALGSIIAIEDNQAPLLSYFRNNILHAFILPSLIASLIDLNGKISRTDLINVIVTLYPFLKAELFTKWNSKTLAPAIEEHIDTLINLGLINNENHQLISPKPNTETHNQLVILAGSVKQSLERYYMILAIITQRGSGNISVKQVEDLGYLLGQRLSVLYEYNSPDVFDKSLFQSFLKVLTQKNYICVKQGIIEFDQYLTQTAQYANLVLDDTKLNMLKHITQFSDEELQEALSALAADNAKRRSRKKVKK